VASSATAFLIALPPATSQAVAPKIEGAGTPCATVQVTANPPVNAQNSPFEKIHNTVTSCATSTETVTLTQHIVGPFVDRAAAPQSGRTWTFMLAPGQSVLKKQFIPYSCCGTYNVHDQVTSSSGVVLAKAKTSFTFA
jgi:hypothetical protein